MVICIPQEDVEKEENVGRPFEKDGGGADCRVGD